MRKISDAESKKALAIMCDDEFKDNFSFTLKARSPLLYITTNEERRFIEFLDHFCRIRGYKCFLWDSYNGLVRLSDRQAVGGATGELKANANAMLDYIISEARTYEKAKSSIAEQKENQINGVIYVLLDFFRFIVPNPDIERRLKALSDISSSVCTIITGPYYHATEVLDNIIPVLDLPFANRDEIKAALYDVTMGASEDMPDLPPKTKAMEEDLVNAASGLTLHEAQSAFSKSLVAYHDWDIPTILAEKKQIISKSGMLEYFDKPVSMDDVGGLKRLVGWIKDRKLTFSKEAVEYGLKKPRGLLTIGMPGCGKSLICKAISSA